ncbi:hypothetical protein K7W42_10340 [Deinococcus sp. HMF7604]|uniref:hypothetical protein n=1 Tax=Deinococcus betulae TaxID=2873312 RepID=UPI001CC94648|nr:hypothetical protein [Deinococcus betulae]MBZ9751263.1 hypothetical protein [Deinococcus betulae]
MAALHGGAWACSPLPPSPALLQAQAALEAAQITSPLCAGKDESSCAAYRLGAAQAAALRLTVAREVSRLNLGAPLPELTLRQQGSTWHLTESVRYGLDTQLRAVPGGSVALTTDRQTAHERVTERLSRAAGGSAFWWSCGLAGLSGAGLVVRDCRWTPATGEWPRTFDFTVVRADASLPPGRYSWYAPDGGSCHGGVPFRKADVR